VTAAGDLTGAVVTTALAATTKELPSAAVHSVKLAMLDLLACCVAGSEDQAARVTAAFASETGTGDCVIVGTPLRASPPLAALANGTAAHALDFDDVSMRMIHPSATLVPALLAVGEARRITGRELLDAYVAGFEVEARLCKVLNPEHYERGWHTTGTIGPLGAALAACRALGVDGERARHALGIAASSASSIRRNFGSMVKPLHAGQAAQHGLQAALLAEQGFTASRSVLEGAYGFLDVFSSLERVSELLDAFAPDAPYEVATSGIALKRFACCGVIHSAQDALLDLVQANGLTADDVVGIDCRVNPLAARVLVHHITQDGLEGKFSMEYSLAVCLVDGRAGLAQYSATRAADPALVPVMERVTVVVDDSIPVNLAYFPSVVTLHLVDGRHVTARVDIPKGYPERALSDDEVFAKVRECCALVLDPARTDQLIETVVAIEDVADVSALATLLAGEVARGS
jgi:2-methylcitrate dehydratase PrpD